MSKVYLVDIKRTPIGSFNGSLSSVSPADLACPVIKDVLNGKNIPLENIDEVVLGNVLMAGQKQGVTRQASIKAGIPDSVVAYGLNMICGSGMKSIMTAYSQIKAGLSHVVVAGGTESMSNAPFLIPANVRAGHKMGDISAKDHIVYDALTDAFENIHMGITAENIAEKFNISREEQDEFAYGSQQKAVAAVDAGRFKEEITAVDVVTRKETITIDTDEYPNRKTNLEKLGGLRPAFVKTGTVTAGNASGINDGAAIALVVSEEAVKKYGLNPMAEIVGVSQAGCAPSVMGLGPAPAIDKLLASTSMKLQDMDLIELNEAFAAQSLGVMRMLTESTGMSKEAIMEKCNVNGGAIALGHPVGASGARITATLIHEMVKRKSTYGLASLCIGGGMGTALILKRV